MASVRRASAAVLDVVHDGPPETREVRADLVRAARRRATSNEKRAPRKTASNDDVFERARAVAAAAAVAAAVAVADAPLPARDELERRRRVLRAVRDGDVARRDARAFVVRDGGVAPRREEVGAFLARERG